MTRLRSLIEWPNLGVVALLATSAHADSLNKDWDNGAANNAFSNATNWNSNALPTTGTGNAGDNIRIDLTGASKAIYGSTVDNPGAGMTSAQAGIFKRLQIADVSGNGELEITGGIFSTDSTTQTTIGSSGRTGILTVNGAGANVRLGGWLSLGHSTGGTGIVNVVNGSFNSTRNATVGGGTGVSIALGNGNNARGTIKLSGGQLVTRTGVLLGVPGTTGVGRFEVWGAGVASIGSENTADDGFWVQSSGSTLAAYVTNGTLGTIYVDNLDPATNGIYADGNVIFMPGSKLEVAFAGATNAGSWDLMKWEGTLLTNGLSFASSVTDTNWSFAFIDTDGTNGPDTLRITYIGAGPPAPPTGLVAVPGNSLVTLRWSALNSATNYHVKRATSPGGPYTSSNDASGLSFTNTGLGIHPEFFQHAMGWEQALSKREATDLLLAATTFGTVVVGTAWYFFTSLFYKSSPQEHKDRVEAFFKNLRTPVDKQGVEDLQTAIYHLLGSLCMVYGAFILLLTFIRNSFGGRMCFLFCGGAIFLAGTILFAIYKRRQKLQLSPEGGGSSSADAHT